MRRFPFTLLMACLLLLASCTGDKVWSHYVHIPLSGWDKADTIVFHVPRGLKPGTYQSTIGLRTSYTFPYQSLTLIVKRIAYPGGKAKTDTVPCHLISAEGKMLGRGSNCYQYSFPLSGFAYHQGDSLDIIVRHDMKREIMPGISEVGVELMLP